MRLPGASGTFLVALFLWLWGFEQGYPDFYGQVDEIGVAASVWNYFRVWTLQPSEFTYPAFYSYLVAAGLLLTQLFGWGLSCMALRTPWRSFHISIRFELRWLGGRLAQSLPRLFR